MLAQRRENEELAWSRALLWIGCCLSCVATNHLRYGESGMRELAIEDCGMGGSDASMMFFELNLKMDDSPSDISWKLTSSNAGLLLEGGGYGNEDQGKSLRYRKCIARRECYTFTIKDSYGDGLCGDDRRHCCGWYSLLVNQELLVEDKGNFGASDEITFGKGCNDAAGESKKERVRESHFSTTFETRGFSYSEASRLGRPARSMILDELEGLKNTAGQQQYDQEPSLATAPSTPITMEELVRFIGLLEMIDQMASTVKGSRELINGVVLAETDAEAEPDVRRKTVTDNMKDPLAPKPLYMASAAQAMSETRWRPLSQPLVHQVDDARKAQSSVPPKPTVLRQAIDLLAGIVGIVPDFAMLEYETYPIYEEYPNESLSPMMKMLRGIPPLEYFFSVDKFVRILKRFLRVFVGLKFNERAMERAGTYERKYRAMFSDPWIFFGMVENPFQLVPLPERVFDNWQDDGEMARQFLAGVNPVMIRVCTSPPTQLPASMVRFLEQQQGYDLIALASQQRLLYATYEELASLQERPHDTYPPPYNGDEYPDDEFQHFHPAVIAFELEASKREEMTILAIQLETENDAPVFSRSTSTATEWLMAKSCVMTADSQYHEWVNHLGRTHLAFEPHIIAIHRTLKMENHPLFDFMKPLTKDTLFLNWAARQTLTEFGEYSFGDRATSVGTGQFMQLIRNEWLLYDFFQSSALPNELASRGFDETFVFPGYLYREDGMKLWDAMGSFATDFVNEVYSSDQEVQDDVGLQRWAQETSDPDKASITGFPSSFVDRVTLASTLQTMMWISTGLHAALNYGQYEYLTYAPNKPLGARAGMDQFHSAGANSKEWIFREAYPFFSVVQEIIYIVRILTLPSEAAIDNIMDHFETTRYGQRAYQAFRARLDTIGNEIEARNQQRAANGGAVYAYLHPSNVPSSINI